MPLLQKLNKLLFNSDRKDQHHLNALQEHKESSIAENISAIDLSLCSSRALKNTNRDTSEKIEDEIRAREKTDDKVKVRDKIEDANTGLDTSKQNNNDKLRDNIDIMRSKGIKEKADSHDISVTGTESSMAVATQPIRDRKGNRRKKQPGSTHGGLIVREHSNSSHDGNMPMIAV